MQWTDFSQVQYYMLGQLNQTLGKLVLHTNDLLITYIQ